MNHKPSVNPDDPVLALLADAMELIAAAREEYAVLRAAILAANKRAQAVAR